MKLLHQTAFTACCVIRVDDASAGGFIQVLNSGSGRLDCFSDIIALDTLTCFLDEAASASAIDTIINTTLNILTNALDCGFVISHRKHAAEV